MRTSANYILPGKMTKLGLKHIPGAKILVRGNFMFQAFTTNKLSQQIYLMFGMKLSPIVCNVIELNDEPKR